MREIFITSSVLILAILLIRMLAKGKINPCIQYTLWLLVVIRLILPVPLWNSRFSVMNLFPEVLINEIDGAVSAGDGMSFDTIRTDGRVNLHDVGKTGVGAEEYNSKDAGNVIGIYDPKDANNAAEADIVDDAAISDRRSAESISDMKIVNNTAMIAAFKLIENILPFIWITGVIITGGYMLFYQKKWKSYLYENRKPLDGMERYMETLSVYTVESLPSPCLSGQGIYLTREMAEDKAELEHILAHEYCHYRQLDTVWVVVRCVLTVVYWFNPLVWVAAYVSKQDSELACDAAAIRLLGEDNRFAYGKTLVKLVSGTTHNKYMIGIASTMSGKEKGIKERIGMIAGKRKYIAAAAVAVLLIAVGLIAVTFSGAGNIGDGPIEMVEAKKDGESDETGIDEPEAGDTGTGSAAQADQKWIKVMVNDSDGNEYEGWISRDYDSNTFYCDDLDMTFTITDSEKDDGDYSIIIENGEGDEITTIKGNNVDFENGLVYNYITDEGSKQVNILFDGEKDVKKMQNLTELEAEIAAKEAAIKEAETEMKAAEEQMKAAENQMKDAEGQKKTAEEQEKAAEVQRQAAEMQKLISEMEAAYSMLENEKYALEAEVQAAEDALKDPSLNLLCYGYISSGNEKVSYVNPCPEYTRISDNYGSRVHPMTGIERMHYGIDLAAEKGADIVAAADGIVQDTGFDTSNGNYVILCHLSNGEFTYYTHCSDILVKEGDNVTAGEKIAEVGSTGRSTGAHLHFAVSKGGEYIEPVLEIK